MLSIVTPFPTDVTAEQVGDYVTISYNSATLTLPVLPKPSNTTEVVYLGDDGSLQFIPGTVPTIVAVLACGVDPMTLTLYVIATPAENTNPLETNPMEGL
jgi:hypothetical protein